MAISAAQLMIRMYTKYTSYYIEHFIGMLILSSINPKTSNSNLKSEYKSSRCTINLQDILPSAGQSA